MNVLVIGSGGREHAIAWKLAQSPKVEKVYCIPGNPGIAEVAECVALDAGDNDALLQFAQGHNIGLTIVGPELPLTNGVVDQFTAAGLPIFGPTKAAAEIEGSKAFAKDLMQRHGIPTAKFAVFSEPAAAHTYLDEIGAPVVVKADGLAAGKGVVVAMDLAEAHAAVDMIMGDQVFGSAGARVVVEEYLEGEEASLLTFCDGKTVVQMVSAQDHKRIFDGDQGPNTGGMGAYAPAPVATPEILERVQKEILEPTVKAMQEIGRPYVGCLYAGLMITAEGPKVIEFNARFGDPETQVVLPLLESDLVDVALACVEGRLAETEVKWKNGAAVCVVIASGGYPATADKGRVIRGLAEASATGAVVFHAGTVAVTDEIVTAGGRVLGVTALGETVAEAVATAYAGVDEICFEGMQFRRDIAYRAMNRR